MLLDVSAQMSITGGVYTAGAMPRGPNNRWAVGPLGRGPAAVFGSFLGGNLAEAGRREAEGKHRGPVFGRGGEGNSSLCLF